MNHPTAAELAAKLHFAKRSDGEYWGPCVAHTEKTASLHFRDGDKGVIFTDFGAGCTYRQITDALIARGLWPTANGHEQRGCSLRQFADYKRLPVEFLEQHGVKDIPGKYDKCNLAFTSYFADGQPAPRYRIRYALEGAKRFCWNEADGAVVAYGLSWLRHEGSALFVEGESDTLTGLFHHINTLGFPGASTPGKHLTAEVLAGLDSIVIAQEPGKGGQAFRNIIVGALQALKFAGAVSVIRWSDEIKDLSKLHLKHRGNHDEFLTEYESLLEHAELVDLCDMDNNDSNRSTDNSQRAGDGIEVVATKGNASPSSREIGWVWRNYIPLAELISFVSLPKIGAADVSFNIAATLTTGGHWPDLTQSTAAEIAVVTDDRDWQKIVRPRLEANGADLARVNYLRLRKPGGKKANLDISAHLAGLEEKLHKLPDVRLIIIRAFFYSLGGGVDVNKTHEVGPVLRELVDVADRCNAAILVEAGLNKTAVHGIESRISGASAFVDIPAATWLVAPATDDDSLRLFLNVAKDYGPNNVPGRAFRTFTDQGHAAPRVVWEINPIWTKASDAVGGFSNSRRGPKPAKRERAKTLIQRMLADGQDRQRKDIEAAAEAAGISNGTLKDAARELGVEMQREDAFHSSSTWRLDPNVANNGTVNTERLPF